MPDLDARLVSRRNALKTLAVVSGAVALSTIPAKWGKPLVEVGALPAHAQTSALIFFRLNVDIEWPPMTRAKGKGLAAPARQAAAQYSLSVYSTPDGCTFDPVADLVSSAGPFDAGVGSATGFTLPAGDYLVRIHYTGDDARDFKYTVYLPAGPGPYTSYVTGYSATKRFNVIFGKEYTICRVTLPSPGIRSDNCP